LDTTFRPQIENHLAILAAVEFFSDRLARSGGVMFPPLRRRDALHRTLEAHWAYRGVLPAARRGRSGGRRCCRLPAGIWPIADGLQAICPTLLEITKDFDSGRRREMVFYACPKPGRLWRRVMTEKTCAACDCRLDENAIKVKIGTRVVEVCCDECAQKLGEAIPSKES
jgi:hypothetical protein